MKKRLTIPKFRNEDEEREFWAAHDFTDYFDAEDFVKVSFPNLKPTTWPISTGHLSKSVSIKVQSLLDKRVRETGTKR